MLAAWLLIAALDSAAGAAPTAHCTLEAVAPVKGKKDEAIGRWLEEKAEDLEPGETDLRLFKRYLVDLDGDGKDDLVFVGSQGSGGYLDLHVFHPTKDGWEEALSPLDDQSLAAATDYFDPTTGTRQPLVRFCGKVYLTTLDGRSPNWSRAAWSWDGKIAHRVCDAAWMDEQRRAFRKLFDAGHYDEAHGFLDGAQESCRSAMSPTTWLWMQSDLALTAHRMGTEADCLEHIRAAKEGPEFAQASPAVQKALETNAELCRTGGSAKSPPDFRWLLELESDSPKQFVLDDRFDRVLTAIVPDVKIAGEALRDTLKNQLFLPDAVKVTDHRYVTLTGCRPHDCGSKGLAWIDTESGKSAIAVNGMIASTTLAPGDLTRELREQMAAAVPGLDGNDTVFVGKDGKEVKLGPFSR